MATANREGGVGRSNSCRASGDLAPWRQTACDAHQRLSLNDSGRDGWGRYRI